MKYWVLTILGYALAGAAIIAGAWALLHLPRVGTCASGGPYVSAHPCPKGTGGWIMGLIGGIFGVLIAGGMLAARGSGPFRPSGAAFAGIWTVGFGLLAYAVLYSASGPANPNPHHSHVGSYITAGIFILLAIPGLFLFLKSFLPSSEEPAPSPVAASVATPMPSSPPKLRPRAGGPVPLATVSLATGGGSGPGSGEDRQLARLEKLGELHANGTLTDAEFAEQKARILAEG